MFNERGHDVTLTEITDKSHHSLEKLGLHETMNVKWIVGKQLYSWSRENSFHQTVLVQHGVSLSLSVCLSQAVFSRFIWKKLTITHLVFLLAEGPYSSPVSWWKLQHAFPAPKTAFLCTRFPWLSPACTSYRKSMFFPISPGFVTPVAALHFTSYYFNGVQRAPSNCLDCGILMTDTNHSVASDSLPIFGWLPLVHVS